MIYLRLEEDVKLTKKDVYLKDVAQITGAGDGSEKKLNDLEIYRFEGEENQRAVLSIISIIEKIGNEFPDIEISPMGGMDVVLQYFPRSTGKKRFSLLKIVLVCGICFFGAAFSIMAFHNDIGIQELCSHIYEMVGMERQHSFPVLELGYSVGLGGGIIIFYNHIGKRRITNDPTPIEVEMRLYEKDVNDTIIENAKRIQQEE